MPKNPNIPKLETQTWEKSRLRMNGVGMLCLVITCAQGIPTANPPSLGPQVTNSLIALPVQGFHLVDQRMECILLQGQGQHLALGGHGWRWTACLRPPNRLGHRTAAGSGWSCFFSLPLPQPADVTTATALAACLSMRPATLHKQSANQVATLPWLFPSRTCPYTRCLSGVGFSSKPLPLPGCMACVTSPKIHKPRHLPTLAPMCGSLFKLQKNMLWPYWCSNSYKNLLNKMENIWKHPKHVPTSESTKSTSALPMKCPLWPCGSTSSSLSILLAARAWHLEKA